MNRPDRGERPRRGAARTRRCTQSMHPRPRPRPSGGPASRGWGSSAWASTNRRTEYRPSYGAVLKKLPSRADFCGGNADCPRSTRAPVLRPRTGSRNVATGYSRASEDSRLARPLRQGRADSHGASAWARTRADACGGGRAARRRESRRNSRCPIGFRAARRGC